MLAVCYAHIYIARESSLEFVLAQQEPTAGLLHTVYTVYSVH